MLVKTLNDLLDEVMDDHLEFMKSNHLIDKDGKLLCTAKEHNDILKVVLKRVFHNYPSYLLLRDVSWGDFFDDRFLTGNCTSIVWGAFKKPKNSVDYTFENPPTEITDFYSMDGEFIEEATKAYKHLCKHFYPDLQ